MKPRRAESLLCAEHWACGFCPSEHCGSRYYYHPHLAERPAVCREGKGLAPSHTEREGTGVPFLTSGQTRLERGWGRRERKGWVCTADKGPQSAAAAGRPPLGMGDSFSRAAEGPDAFGGRLSAGRALGHSPPLDPGVWWSLDKGGALTYTLCSREGGAGEEGSSG